MVTALAGDAGQEGFRLEGVGFAADARFLLEGVTLSLGPGRVTGIIGHNGSGKSTLLKLMARQQAPAKGAIRFDGRGLDEWSTRAFARRVAYLPQTPPSAGALTVRELVACGRYPWHGALGRKGAQDRAAVADALTLTGLADFARPTGGDALRGRAPARLAGHAGGAAGAVSAAGRACRRAGRGPSGGGDGARRTLCEARGLGVAVVLHDVNLAARYCDELIALRGGRLLMRGPPAEIVTTPALGEIYGIPMAVISHPDGGWPVSFVR